MRVPIHEQNQTKQRSSPETTRSGPANPVVRRQLHPILKLQRTIGNQAVLRLLQAKSDRSEAQIAARRRLFARELTHGVQQQVSSSPEQPSLQASNPRLQLPFQAVQRSPAQGSEVARQAVGERDRQREADPASIVSQQIERASARRELQDFKKQWFSGEVDLSEMTGSGAAFGAAYFPMFETLWIQVLVRFDFQPGYRLKPVLQGDRPATLERMPEKWEASEKDAWKQNYLKLVSEKWSGKHIFYCQRDWWEDLRAEVKVNFQEQTEPTMLTTYEVKVEKSGAEANVWGRFVHLTSGGTEVDQEGRSEAAHEAGHMLGLGDEYWSKEHAGEEASHSSLVEQEFSHKVIRGEAGKNLMSESPSGAILPQHGVTFLQALKQVTKMDEWSAHKKPRRRILLRAGGE
jgi:hypothetical protein